MQIEGFGTILKNLLAGGGFFYTEAFGSSAEWIVNHNMGRAVSVRVCGLSGQEVVADVRYPTLNQARVLFDVPTAGSVCVH